jgi:hypothetical protein
MLAPLLDVPPGGHDFIRAWPVGVAVPVTLEQTDELDFRDMLNAGRPSRCDRSLVDTATRTPGEIRRDLSDLGRAVVWRLAPRTVEIQDVPDNRRVCPRRRLREPRIRVAAPEWIAGAILWTWTALQATCVPRMPPPSQGPCQRGMAFNTGKTGTDIRAIQTLARSQGCASDDDLPRIVGLRRRNACVRCNARQHATRAHLFDRRTSNTGPPTS